MGRHNGSPGNIAHPSCLGCIRSMGLRGVLVAIVLVEVGVPNRQLLQILFTLAVWTPQWPGSHVEFH